MAKEELIQFTGKIIEVLPNMMFKVKLDNGHILLGYLAGNMRKNDIKVILNDVVKIELTPYDLTKGRIIYRQKK